MITFLSVFLGLIAGVKPIELAVSGDVAEVEVRLNGELVGLLRGEPWKVNCDFGRELSTHELVAIARSPTGAELDRAVQLINVPGPQVEAQMILEDWQAAKSTGRKMPRSARLIWRAVHPVEPLAVSVTLDGQTLADRYLERYQLPELDSRSIHFLSARLDFPDNLSASAEVVFGGVYGSATETELTAVPLIVAGRKLRQRERLQGRLAEDGEDLRVVALEPGPAEVILVRDRRAIPHLTVIDSRYSIRSNYEYATLADQDAALLMSPRAYLSTHSDARFTIFPLTQPTTRRSGITLPRMLSSYKFTVSPVLPQQLTNAVAAAGLRAAASQKRRAVVLVTSNCDDISGQWSPQGTREYLAQLRVPFRVWVVTEPANDEGFCDGAEPIHDVRLFQFAIKRLRRDLLSQQIVWVEGQHLLRKIDLTGDPNGVRLAE